MIRSLILSILLSISFQLISSESIGAIPLDGHEKNLKNVYYRDGNALSFVGFADLDAISERVAPSGLTATEAAPGLGIAALVFLEYGAVEGCGCPRAFSEFIVFYQVNGKTDEQKEFINFGTDYWVSNHIVRKAVLQDKFKVYSGLGNISMNLEEKVFSLSTPQGLPLLDLAFPGEWPEPGNAETDAVVHNRAQKVGDTDLSHSFYRILTHTQSTQRFFNPSTDTFEFDESSELGLLINGLNFSPLQMELSTGYKADMTSAKTLKF